MTVEEYITIPDTEQHKNPPTPREITDFAGQNFVQQGWQHECPC